MARHVLHVDMDAFYAAVEQRDDPTLRGRPVLVGGDRRRGVVTSASYEARMFGIHSAMPMAAAIARCPGAVVVRGRMDHYVAASRQIRQIFRRFTPLVEPLSLDEAFLDVTASTALFGPPPEIAEQVRQAVRTETGLTASAGVAPNKFIAKIASDLAKPDGLVVVPPDAVEAFLHPLPVRHLWGVGRVTEAALHRLGYRTLGDLAVAEPARLARHVGAGAGALQQWARGIDDRPVRPDRNAKSMGEEETLDRDRPAGELLPYLLADAESIARRLRAHVRRARTVTLKVKLAHPPGPRTLTRRHTLAEPTADEAVLFAVARRLLGGLALGSRRVRLVGLAVENLLAGDGDQLALFATERSAAARRAALARAVDELVRRFGAATIRRRLPGEA